MIERIFFLEAGFCTHPECTVIKGGRLGQARFPAMVAAIVHKQHGVVLFDTGYSPRFREVTRHGAGKLYAWMTPVTVDGATTAAAQLARHGVKPADVRHVILSHFHADHVAGLKDFPNAKIIHRDIAYSSLKGLKGFRAVRKAFLPDLLPDDFEARSRPFAASEASMAWSPYPELGPAYDLLGDRSILGIDLPGHAAGHMGILVGADKEYLLVGDAAWLTRNITELRPPAAVARLLMDDSAAFDRTLRTLHDFKKSRCDVAVVPCHCEVANGPLTKTAGDSRHAGARLAIDRPLLSLR